MSVNLITRDANFDKLRNKYPKLIGFIGDSQTNLQTLSFLDTHHIEPEYKLLNKDERSSGPRPADRAIVFGQLDFYRLMDLLCLMRMRTQYITEWFFNDCKEQIDDCYYWDEFDVQPFRPYLFETKRASLEFMSIFEQIGLSDDSVQVNNFTNTLEIYGKNINKFFKLICDWHMDYEFIVEEFLFDDMIHKSFETLGVLWRNAVLVSMLRRRKFLSISRG